VTYSFCANCGTRLGSIDRYCPSCGTPKKDRLAVNAPNLAPATPALAGDGPRTDSEVRDGARNGYGEFALVIGAISLLAWIIPLVGIPVAGVALLLGATSLRTRTHNGARIALVLASVGLGLSLINGGVGAYYGYLRGVSESGSSVGARTIPGSLTLGACSISETSLGGNCQLSARFDNFTSSPVPVTLSVVVSASTQDLADCSVVIPPQVSDRTLGCQAGSQQLAQFFAFKDATTQARLVEVRSSIT
jgi:hypothetical protein